MNSLLGAIPQKQPGASQQSRVPSLDGIRALAIILVVACHIQVFLKTLSGPLASFCINVGWSGVYLFFVLSGYLIGRLVLKEIAATGKVKLGAFWARRSLRTWPLYFLALFSNYFILPPMGEPHTPSLLRYMTFTQVFSRMNYFIESWTLCIEEQFYLLLPLFVLLILKIASPRRIAIACVLVIGLSYLFRFRYGYAVHPGATFDSLFLGVLIATVEQSRNAAFEFLQKRSYSTFLFSILILFLAFALGGPDLPQFQGFLAIGFGLVLVSALNQGSLLARFLSLRIFRVIALSSYSTYLTHVAIIKVLGHFRIVPMRPATLLSPFVFLFSSGVVFVGGWLCYNYIEKPGLRLRELLVPRHASRQSRVVESAPGTGAAASIQEAPSAPGPN